MTRPVLIRNSHGCLHYEEHISEVVKKFSKDLIYSADGSDWNTLGARISYKLAQSFAEALGEFEIRGRVATVDPKSVWAERFAHSVPLHTDGGSPIDLDTHIAFAVLLKQREIGLYGVPRDHVDNLAFDSSPSLTTVSLKPEARKDPRGEWDIDYHFFHENVMVIFDPLMPHALNIAGLKVWMAGGAFEWDEK